MLWIHAVGPAKILISDTGFVGKEFKFDEIKFNQ